MEELKIPDEFKFPFEPYDIQVCCVTRALRTETRTRPFLGLLGRHERG